MSKVELHPAVELLLKRMDSRPDLFSAPLNWTWSLSHTLMIATPHEAKLIRAKLRELAGNSVMELMLEEVFR